MCGYECVCKRGVYCVFWWLGQCGKKGYGESVSHLPRKIRAPHVPLPMSEHPSFRSLGKDVAILQNEKRGRQ